MRHSMVVGRCSEAAKYGNITLTRFLISGSHALRPLFSSCVKFLPHLGRSNARVWLDNYDDTAKLASRLGFTSISEISKFHFQYSIMERPTSSQPGPQRSASTLSAHRVSSYSSRFSSAGPVPDNLIFIRTILNEIASSQDLNSDVFPPLTDYELGSISTSEAILIPIVGAVLANMIETLTKVDRLTAAVEALNSPASQTDEAIASLQASVRDLS